MAAILLVTVAYAAAETGRNVDDPRLAETEIARLPVTYAWAVDAKNIDDMMAIFAEDAVYDLSDYGYPSVVGRAAVRSFFLSSVFRAEQCSFSTISNVRVEVRGSRATGADYFVHLGYNDPTYGANTRHYVEGRHYYDFVREGGRWKIARMRGNPTFEAAEKIDAAGVRHCP